MTTSRNLLDYPNLNSCFNQVGINYFISEGLFSMTGENINQYIQNANGFVFTDNKSQITYFYNLKSSTYIFSLKAHYFKYCAYELKAHDNLNSTSKKILSSTLKLMDFFTNLTNVDEMIYVNHNWGSTTLWDSSFKNFLSSHEIPKMNKPFLFRSLNKDHLPEFEKLPKKDWLILYYREALVYENDQSISKKCLKNLEKDFMLVGKHSYEVVGENSLNNDDYLRIEKLYQMLYLNKYTNLNPCYTAAFFKAKVVDKHFKLFCLRKQGKIDAFALYEIRNNLMQVPCIGYDTSLPKELGLYLQITSTFTRYALENKIKFYASDGCAKFKINRGANSYPEFCAIYIDNCNIVKKLSLRLFATLINKVWRRLMPKYFFGLNSS